MGNIDSPPFQIIQKVVFWGQKGSKPPLKGACKPPRNGYISPTRGREKRGMCMHAVCLAPRCVAVSVPLSSVLAGEREILTVSRLLLDQVAQALGQLVQVDLDLGLDLSDPLVDLELDGLASILVGGHGEQRLHGSDRLVPASAARAGVLGLVGSATVQPEVLAQPVVHQAGNVLAQAALVRVLGVDGLAVLEGEDDPLFDQLELSIRELDLARRLLAENFDNRIVDRFALSHVFVLSTAQA